LNSNTDSDKSFTFEEIELSADFLRPLRWPYFQSSRADRGRFRQGLFNR
jgi:hypothetical protein